MCNFSNHVNQIICRISKGNITESSLVPIFIVDEDFDFKKATKVSKQIYKRNINLFEDDEFSNLHAMVEEVFEVDNFIGTSDQYNGYTFKVVETEFEYIIFISYIS
jgi:hypothetical protein